MSTSPRSPRSAIRRPTTNSVADRSNIATKPITRSIGTTCVREAQQSCTDPWLKCAAIHRRDSVARGTYGAAGAMALGSRTSGGFEAEFIGMEGMERCGSRAAFRRRRIRAERCSDGYQLLVPCPAEQLAIDDVEDR